MTDELLCCHDGNLGGLLTKYTESKVLEDSGVGTEHAVTGEQNKNNDALNSCEIDWGSVLILDTCTVNISFKSALLIQERLVKQLNPEQQKQTVWFLSWGKTVQHTK